jgi:CubicO group peptidase (beta-lactamase class C family)
MLLKSLQKSFIVTIFIISFHTSYAQFDTTAISTKLNQAKDKLGKDVAFILYNNGKILYKKEMGNFTVKTPQPIGASSQWLTATLVMTFVQEGKLSLDDKVTNYLPYFAEHLKNYITIRQCLTNYTGIQSDQGVAKLLQKNKFKSLEDEVNNFASRREIETNAGSEFKYSTVGYNIAGRVLEVIARKPFDRLMQDRITRPLQMRNTTFTNEDYNDAVNPATGARSTAADYINFLSMLLNKGIFNNKQILTESSIAILHTISAEAAKIKYAPKAVEGLNYGTGEWILESNAQGKTIAATVPSLQGTWPMVDLCRGYACIIFTKNLPGEQTRNLYMDIKATIDNGFPGNCK